MISRTGALDVGDARVVAATATAARQHSADSIDPVAGFVVLGRHVAHFTKNRRGNVVHGNDRVCRRRTGAGRRPGGASIRQAAPASAWRRITPAPARLSRPGLSLLAGDRRAALGRRVHLGLNVEAGDLQTMVGGVFAVRRPENRVEDVPAGTGCVESRGLPGVS